MRIYQVSPKTSDVTMTIHMSLRRLRNESFVDNLFLTLIFCGRYYSPALLFAAAYSLQSCTVRRHLQFAVVYSSPPFTVSHRLQFAAVYS